MLPINRRAFCQILVGLALVSVRVFGAGYVSPTAIDVAALLPPPPALNSPEGKAELEQVVQVHANTPAAVLRAGAEENNLTVYHFAGVIGDWFQAERLPKADAFFKQIEQDARAINGPAKALWKRQRPCFVGGTRIPHPIEPEEKAGLSYPSGHSVRGTVFALVLAELLPNQRDDILKKGRETGYLRVQGGMHYPSDVFAGRVLGQAIFNELMKNPQFTKDLAEVAAELVRAQE